jgi:hypothetical protein
MSRGVAMRTTILLIVAVLPGLGLRAGCDDFSNDDVTQLEQYGGFWVPNGEGPTAQMAPVDAVTFSSSKRALTDADFAEVFPIVKRMDPYRLHLTGNHPLGDKSIELLNKLRSLKVLDASGTEMTLDGLKKLKLSNLRQVSVSPRNFTEADIQALEEALPSEVKVFRGR